MHLIDKSVKKRRILRRTVRTMFGDLDVRPTLNLETKYSSSNCPTMFGELIVRPVKNRLKRLSVGFQAARQRRYKILLFRPVCGYCAAWQLVLVSAAWRQNQASRGMERVIFLTPDGWY